MAPSGPFLHGAVKDLRIYYNALRGDEVRQIASGENINEPHLVSRRECRYEPFAPYPGSQNISVSRRKRLLSAMCAEVAKYIISAARKIRTRRGGAVVRGVSSGVYF